jgi:hypothetical protein
MGREEVFTRREAGGMPHDELFASLEAELASHCLGFGQLEGQGMRREARGMRREEVFTRREGGGMAHSLPFAPLEREIAAFFLAFGWREARGMGREE